MGVLIWSPFDLGEGDFSQFPEAYKNICLLKIKVSPLFVICVEVYIVKWAVDLCF